jgi:hypothetical protein
MTNRPPLIGRSVFTLVLVLAWFGSALPRPSRVISGSDMGRDARPVQSIKSAIASEGIPFKSLPLRFELNSGQTDSQVRFTADTPSGLMFLTPNELVMRVFEPAKHISAKERRRSPEANNFSPDGSSLVYSTYLGGNGLDVPYGTQLDSSNNVFVYGSTSSTNFPTVNPTQAAYGGGSSDGFWSVISPGGSQLLFSTYVGGNGMDYVLSLTVNDQEDVCISGPTTSSNFAGNDGSPNTYLDGFLPLSSASQLTPQQEESIGFNDFAVHLLGAKLAQDTSDPNLFAILFPPLSHGFGSSLGKSGPANAQQQAGEIEVFVSNGCVIAPSATTCSGQGASLMIDPITLAITSLTNITSDIPLIANAAVRDSQDAMYVTGSEPTNPLFPLVNPVQPAGGGGVDAFVTVFAPVTRQIVFSTYIGGSGDDSGAGIALDPRGTST